MEKELKRFMNESIKLLKSIKIITQPILPTHPGELPVDGRARLVPGYDHNAIRHSIVALIGAGGINSEVGQALVRKGVGSIIIFDDDTVEITNLHRQLYYKKDLYKPKALALAENLSKEATHKTVIVGYPYTFEEVIENETNIDFTLAVCGVDKDSTRIYCSRYFLEKKIPVIFIGIDRQASNGYVFIQESKPNTPCFACLFPGALDNNERTPCAAGSTIDILKIVAGIATYAIDSLIMLRRRTWNFKAVFLSGEIPDGHTMIKKRDECPLCKMFNQ